MMWLCVSVCKQGKFWNFNKEKKGGEDYNNACIALIYIA